MSASKPNQRLASVEELRVAIAIQLPAYLAKQRWFGGKARQVRSAELVDAVPFQHDSLEAFFLLARVEYQSGPGETYVLPLLCQEASAGLTEEVRSTVFLSVGIAGQGARLILTDALENPDFLTGLLQAIEKGSSSQGWKGEILATRTGELQRLLASPTASSPPKLLRGEQSNSSIIFGQNLILKIFRRLDKGLNPDLEIGLFLSEKARFKNTPPVAGSLEYRDQNGQSAAIGILQGFVPNQGDAWRFTLDHLAAFRREVTEIPIDSRPSPLDAPSEVFNATMDSPTVPSLVSYLSAVELLARRTAQLHQALASDSSDPAFAPEPYSAEFRSSMDTSTAEMTQRNFALLAAKRGGLPEATRALAEEVLAGEQTILEKVHSTLRSPFGGMRIRIHGDYHLGQVLYTGSDFMIIDFEGEPARPLEARRMKRSALQDIAGMLRSFHYAAFASRNVPPPEKQRLEHSSDDTDSSAPAWVAWVSSRFLGSYLEHSAGASYLPSGRDKQFDLLQVHMLEKAIYELGYELNNRPSWVGIPLAGISALLHR